MFFFVGIFYILLFALYKYKRINLPLFSILTVSFTLRIILLLISTKYTGIITFHKDNVAFEELAWDIANQSNFFNFNTKEVFVIIIAFIYKIFGRNYLIACLVNIFASLISGLLMYRIVKENFKNEYYGLIAAVIFLFMPYGIFMSIILLRQNIITLCVCAWLYFITKFFCVKKVSVGILSVICAAIGAAFHSGLVIFAAATIGIIFLMEILTFIKDKKRSRLYVLLAIVIIVFFAVFMAKDIIMRKFYSGSNLFDSVINTIAVYVVNPLKYARPGNSGYLINYDYKKSFFHFIFYFILQIVYFIFSPMLWDISRLKDLVGFFGDSLFYIGTVIFLVIETIRRIRIRKPISIKNKLIFLCLVFVSAGFSIACFNAGTAMRHRLNIFPILVYAIFYSKLFTGLIEKIKTFIVSKCSKNKEIEEARK